MSIIVHTNLESLAAQKHLAQNDQAMSQSLERLSSGFRINHAVDDAAGLAISENLKAQTRSLTQAKRNANDGVSLLQTAESSLNQVSNIMIRLRELTMQAASETIGVKEKAYLNEEYQQLLQEVDRIGETTEFNGYKLLGPPPEDGIVLQVGYRGDKSDLVRVTWGNVRDGINTETLGVFETDLTDMDEGDFAENLQTIDRGLSLLAKTRATIGSSQSRLNIVMQHISDYSQQLTAAASKVQDADFAEETSNLAKSRILTQASLAVLAQANQRPEMALALLRA